MSDNDVMPFGKYKGERLSDVPDSYLLWLYQSGSVSGQLKKYLLDNIESIQFNVKNKGG